MILKRKLKNKLQIYVKFKDYERDLYDWVVLKSRANRGNKNQTVIEILSEARARDMGADEFKGLI